jgi:hypothetical protein
MRVRVCASVCISFCVRMVVMDARAPKQLQDAEDSVVDVGEGGSVRWARARVPTRPVDRRVGLAPVQRPRRTCRVPRQRRARLSDIVRVRVRVCMCL